MGGIATAYAEGRHRITELVADLDEASADTVVPTCPAWTVRNVLGHLAGVCADIVAGNLEGVATDPWTQAQVDARRDRSVRDLLDEWGEFGPQVEAMADVFPGRTGQQLVLDLTTHEHDVRLALDRPGARDSPGVDIGVDFLVSMGLQTQCAVLGIGPLEVRAGEETWVAGGRADGASEALWSEVLMGADPPVADTPPVGTLTLPPFELFRALTGRRSDRQIRAYDWSLDPTPYLPVFSFGPFTASPTDIDE
jgi:uncharacterized protein (TIGR03083 family)